MTPHAAESFVLLLFRFLLLHFLLSGTPKGIRTPVTALKGLSPSPLDDGGMFAPKLLQLLKSKLSKSLNNNSIVIYVVITDFA